MNMITNNKNSNIIVTGGCGFIGSYVVDQLVKEGYNVFVIDINTPFTNKKATY